MNEVKDDVKMNIFFKPGYGVEDISAYWFHDKCKGEDGNREYTFYSLKDGKVMIIGNMFLYWGKTNHRDYREISSELETFLKQFERAEYEWRPGSGSYEYICFKKDVVLPEGYEWNYW